MKPKKDKAMAQPAVEQNIGEITVPNPHRIKLPDLKVVRGGTELRHDPDVITVKRSTRNDPLARLHDGEHITNAEYLAGREAQRLYEAIQIGRIGSPSNIVERVDGTSPIREPGGETQRKAHRKIAKFEAALGVVMTRIVRDVLIDGLDMAQVSMRRGQQASEFSRKYYGRQFREALEVLVKELGYG